MLLEFGSATPFGISGDGDLCIVTLTCEFRDNCVATMSISQRSSVNLQPHMVARWKRAA
jgi:hypothetical protein